MNARNEAHRFSLVDRLFALALELPEAERARFLEAACPADLRTEVLHLLAADAASDGFLERPVARLRAEREGESAAPEGRLGPYRLLREIGAGGMGTVHLAVRDDAQYERQVAIKVLRAGLSDPAARHRFLAERQILARLEHPGIARLYDGGTTADGRPYLVMEWIDGLPLTEYCDRHRLPVEARLHLFLKVAAAVQYAHQNLLVHRDLKPGNILVTAEGAEGEPRLIDFGIAKQLAPEGRGGDLTRTGLRLLTPSYASPEQVQGEAITTASDVYSLGVLLYELLAGRSPYRVEPGLLHEMERAICEEEPERPSQALLRSPRPPDTAVAIAAARGTRPAALRRRLSGDLDNIVLMALRKEPGRRYGSAAQLAADLASHLGDLPVLARPDTLAYRSRKFVRRHRTAVAAGLAVLLVLAGFVASLVAEERRLALERDKARYALSFLVDVFENADPNKTAGATLTAREILARGAARAGSELSGPPEVQATVLDTIGQVGVGLGQAAETEPLLRRSAALRKAAFGASSPEYAESLAHLASARSVRGDLPGAVALLDRALAIERRQLPGDDLRLAQTLNQLGESVLDQRPPEVAERLHEEALAIARKAEGPRGLTVAASLLDLAIAAERRGSYERAEALYRQGFGIERERLGEAHPTVVHHAAAFSEILFDRGKLAEAEALLERSIAALERTLGRDHFDLAMPESNLAILLLAEGRHAEAEVLFRRALAIWEPRMGNADWRLATAYSNLGAAVLAQGRPREAVALHERALAMRRKIFGDRHPQVGNSLLLLAQVHRELKEYPEALALGQQALSIVREGLGPTHPTVSSPLREIGRILLAAGRPQEALPYLREAVALRAKALPPNHPELAHAEVTLGICLTALGRYPEAEALLTKAHKTLAGQLRAGDERVREAEAALAALGRARG